MHCLKACPDIAACNEGIHTKHGHNRDKGRCASISLAFLLLAVVHIVLVQMQQHFMRTFAAECGQVRDKDWCSCHWHLFLREWILPGDCLWWFCEAVGSAQAQEHQDHSAIWRRWDIKNRLNNRNYKTMGTILPHLILCCFQSAFKHSFWRNSSFGIFPALQKHLIVGWWSDLLCVNDAICYLWMTVVSPS